MSRKSIKLSLDTCELVYDIQNKAYLTGEARRSEGAKPFEAASNMQASDDDDNIYQIKRSLCTALASLKSIFGEFIRSDDDDVSLETNNALNQAVELNKPFDLFFSVPSNFKDSAADSLGDEVHAYLVDMALGDWFSITNKEDAQIYTSRVEQHIAVIKRALYRRTRPIKAHYVDPV